MPVCDFCSPILFKIESIVDCWRVSIGCGENRNLTRAKLQQHQAGHTEPLPIEPRRMLREAHMGVFPVEIFSRVFSIDAITNRNLRDSTLPVCFSKLE